MTDRPRQMENAQLLDEYERVRANALGAANRSRGLALLLRHGMGAWVRMVGSLAPTSGESRGSGCVPVPVGDVGIDRATAVVLADAILAMARAATGVQA